MSEQPSRLTVKVRLETQPLQQQPVAALQAPFSLWRLGFALASLFAVAAALSWAWLKWRPDPVLVAATKSVSSAKAASSGDMTVAKAALPDAARRPLAAVQDAEDVALTSVENQAKVAAVSAHTETQLQVAAPLTPAERPQLALPAGFSRIVLTAHMRNLEPGPAAGEQIHFPTVKRLYLFTELKGYAGQVLQHRWYFQNQLKTTATLTIEDSPWRTYSENWLLENQLGDWRVEIVDQTQQVLYQHTFNYQ